MRILKVLNYSFEYFFKTFILGFTLDCFHRRFLSITPGDKTYVIDPDAIGLQNITLKLLRWRPDHPDTPMGLM
jgi:hypothetical protein